MPFDAIRDSRKPVIAAVNGLCMGGGLLITMLVRRRDRQRPRRFGAPELRRGVADAYHAAILPEHVGIALARDMLFTGRRLTAHEAERHGLVARGRAPRAAGGRRPTTWSATLLERAAGAVALKRLINARYGAIDKITFDESVAATRSSKASPPSSRSARPRGFRTRPNRRPGEGSRL